MLHFLKEQYKIYLDLKTRNNKSQYFKLKIILFKTNIFFIFLTFLTMSIFSLYLNHKSLFSYILLFFTSVASISYFLECLLQLKLEDKYSLFLIPRASINITLFISFTLFFNNILINYFMNDFFQISPRIALVSFSFFSNFLLSEIISLLLIFIIPNKYTHNIKLQILYFIKYFLFVFIISGFFLMLLFKDYNFFITNATPEKINQISNDIYNNYIQLVLLFFIYKIILPKINIQINNFKSEK